jgi:uncharacterized membrane protein YbhN (UPF0104 family)
VLAVVATVAIVYGALPQLGVVHDAWAQASSGDMWWVAGAAVIEVLSFAGYAALFMAVLGGGRIDWPASWLITLSGVAATRLFAAGGTGGVALTAWALRRSGRDGGQTTAEMTSFLLLLYAVYMSALALAAGGLLVGVLPGAAPTALTGAGVVLGVGAIVVVPLLGLLPRQTRRAGRLSLGARLRSILDGIPAGVRRARRLVATRDPLLLGAVAWWTFDIAALAATLHAFGQHLSAAPLIVAYFMGMLGNLLPLPGGIGGVEGGMIGALIACGVDSGAAVGAVLAYRLVSLWLPTACGVIAYGALVRRTHTWTAELETASDSGELPG